MTPMDHENIKKVFEQQEAKRSKLDFKAFYYAITLVAQKAYSRVPKNQALLMLIEKVQGIALYFFRISKSWRREARK